MTREFEEARSFLTAKDREYLHGNADLSEGSEYNVKRRIRRRIAAAFLDFSLLFDHLDEEEAEKIFEVDSGTWRIFENEEFRAGVRDTLAFILYHHDVAAFMGVGGAAHGHPVEVLLEEAYTRAGREADFLVEDVAPPEIEAIRLQYVLRALDRGEDVSATALGKVLETEILEEEAVDEIRDIVQDEVSDSGE